MQNSHDNVVDDGNTDCSKPLPTLSPAISIHGKSIKYYSHVELTSFPVVFFYLCHLFGSVYWCVAIDSMRHEAADQ